MRGSAAGWISGLIGVGIFSGSLPATRVAVQTFPPLFLTSARASIAALIGLGLLLALRQKRPARADLASLTVIAAGVVVGFPLLTALALQHISAARSLVFIGLLPLSTAVFGVLRGRERPRPAFWLFSGVGALLVSGFAAAPGAPGELAGDALMAAAVLVCGLGYAEGAVLSRRLGGWQVISWALTLALPVMACLAAATAPAGWTGAAAPAWLALGYVSVFSMLIGFFFWYRGLALGGIAAVSQLQLLQPFFGLALAAVLLGERVDATMAAVAAAVALCVAAARRLA